MAMRGTVRQGRGWFGWGSLLCSSAALASACGGQTPAAPEAGVSRWECPANWVGAAVGGCGPAVLLCVPDGGAADRACDGVDLSRPPTLASPDGGTLPGFYRLPDGGIGGGWPEPAGPGGSWVPEVGVTSCPDGWRLDDGACDPVLRADCPAGSAALPGGACTATSRENCPAGAYADPGAEADGATVVHVSAGADAAGADGSEAHPYPSVAEGVLHAGAVGWVLVAAGEYRERYTLTGARSVHVVGACAARVTLGTPDPVDPEVATVLVDGPGAVLDLRGVTITGGARGVEVERGGVLRLAAAVVADNRGQGVLAGGAGTQMELTGSAVRGTRALADGTRGEGVVAYAGASLRATGVTVQGNASAGILANGAGTQVELTASAVGATRPDAAGAGGVGLAVQGRASLRATGVVVDGSASAGVSANGAGTLVELTGGVVRGSPTGGDGAGGYGLVVNTGASLRATGVGVEGSAQVGVLALGAGTRVELAACAVRGTRPARDGSLGIGLQTQGGASLRAAGVLVDGNAYAGAIATGAGSQVDLTGSVVRGTRPLADGTAGFGLVATGGARLAVGGVVVDGNAHAGVVANDPGTRVEVSASVVRNTHATAAGTYGRGADAELGAALSLTGVLLADNTELAATALGGELLLADTLVVGVSPNARGFGVGLYARRGARVEGTRAAFQGVAGAGLVALPLLGGAGTSVTVTDLFVRDVRPSTVRFNESGSTGEAVGRAVAYGLHPGPGCTIDVSRAVLDRGGLGLFNAAGTVRVRRGVIANQGEGVGAVDLATPADATVLDGVALVGNASDAIPRRDDLPTASQLPAPDSVEP
jgi:hypothetical protein